MSNAIGSRFVNVLRSSVAMVVAAPVASAVDKLRSAGSANNFKVRIPVAKGRVCSTGLVPLALPVVDHNCAAFAPSLTEKYNQPPTGRKPDRTTVELNWATTCVPASVPVVVLHNS